jgi:ATP-dependent Clp protease ATP-binding subunit ClpA
VRRKPYSVVLFGEDGEAPDVFNVLQMLDDGMTDSKGNVVNFHCIHHLHSNIGSREIRPYLVTPRESGAQYWRRSRF